jgi:hypothetical protein
VLAQLARNEPAHDDGDLAVRPADARQSHCKVYLTLASPFFVAASLQRIGSQAQGPGAAGRRGLATARAAARRSGYLTVNLIQR